MDKTTFKFLWKDLERKKGQPFFARKLVVKNFDDFLKKFYEKKHFKRSFL